MSTVFLCCSHIFVSRNLQRGELTTVLLTMLRQEGQQAFSAQVRRLTSPALRNFYGSEALRSVLHELK